MSRILVRDGGFDILTGLFDYSTGNKLAIRFDNYCHHDSAVMVVDCGAATRASAIATEFKLQSVNKQSSIVILYWKDMDVKGGLQGSYLSMFDIEANTTMFGRVVEDSRKEYDDFLSI